MLLGYMVLYRLEVRGRWVQMQPHQRVSSYREATHLG